MFLIEIKNHDTGDEFIVKAESKDVMHNILTSKGFSCMIKGEFYVGKDDEGCEVSATLPVIIPAEHLRPLDG